LATREDIEAMKAKIKVRDPDKNYNVIIDGHGTGLAPPTEQEWEDMIGNVVIVDSVKDEAKDGGNSLQGPLGASINLMADPSFPAVGNQGAEGSCSSWSTSHYMNGFMQAKDEGWTDQHISYGTANKDHLMAVDWVYHKVNGGADSGSSLVAPMRLISTVGNAPESYMPYSTSDHTSWGDESAWRIAPKYRASGVLTTEVKNVDVVKSWVDAGYAVTMALNAGQYGNGWADGNDILSSAEYNPGNPNHANTIVGYDDSITDDGDVGAFKIVNSWGGGWGPNSDGTYYMTYDCFMTLVWGNANRYSSDLANYEPSLIGIWNMNPQGARNAPVELGVGPYGSPEETRRPRWNGGGHDFPFFMALDITEFWDNRQAGTYAFYLEIGSASSSSTISSFKIESYEGGYTPGSPTETSEESPDTPEDTPGYVTIWFPSGKGMVQFDNVAYKSNAVATITVSDKHLNMNPLAVETYVIDEVRSDPTGDSEITTITLTEKNVNMGVFVGTIQLQLGVATPNDGFLQIANGDTITVRYEDANNGTGNPATVFDTALVDDDPPIISFVSATPYYFTAVISWFTDEDSDSEVTYYSAMSPTIIETDMSKVMAHSVILTRLTMETTYYYKVRSTDYAGNTVMDDNNGFYYMFTTLPPENTPWSDDMDSGHDWWSTETDGAGTEWQQGDPAGFGPGMAHSGFYCWGTNIDSAYTDNAEVWLYTPPIDLTLAVGANLTFWNWYDIETYWDGGFLEISIDLGQTWTSIDPVGGYPYINGYFGDGYSGVSMGWVSGPEEEFNLSPYLGNVVLIRFYMVTDAGLTDSGWYVDDIVIDAEFAPIGVTITPSSQSQTGLVNSTVTYNLRVINIGFSDFDTFDMAYFSLSGWTANFYEPDGITPLGDTNLNSMPDTGSLLPSGGFKDLIVKVDIPGSANFTDSDTASITATSSSDPAESDTATLTTTVPYYIVSQLSLAPPTLDGYISVGEWDDARSVDISSSGVLPGTVTMYVRNNQTMLYIAIDDTNDMSLGLWDRMGIYFDENHDHAWPSSSSPTGEGNFWVDWDGTDVLCRYRGIWGIGPNFDTPIPAAGVVGSISAFSGNVQYEVAIDLTTSALQSTGGSTIGLFIFSKDGPSGSFFGEWPPGTLSTWRNPSTYGDLILAQDNEPPTSSVDAVSPYWQATSPLNITATANDIGGTVASVELFYRYSANNMTWGNWNSVGIDMASPWEWSFDFPDGDGYYEFKTNATDSANNVEIDTGTDASCGYDIGLPSSSVEMISPYWLTTSPLTITANANDVLSGLTTVELFYRHGIDNSTWSSWISFGADIDSPWEWSFNFPAGDGYYEFHSKATDNASNEEIGNATDALCAYDATPPVANAGFDISVDEDEMFGLDGSGSTDNLGIVSWTWDFGDGTVSSGVSAAHNYPKLGVYVVTLTVEDMAGNTAMDTLTVYVNNLAPNADAGPDRTINEGEAVILDGSAATDTPSDISTLLYTWYFEDGAVLSGMIVTHVFRDDGIYAVMLVVVDDNGYSDSDTLMVTVNNVAPTADIGGPYSCEEGDEIEFSGSATDPGDDTFTYLWNFGDGETSTQQNPKHVYADDGTYQVTFTVTDDDGGIDVETTMAVVTNRAPVIDTIYGSVDGKVGELFSLDIDATDVEADEITFSDDSDMFIIDPDTGVIQFTPAKGDVGIHEITITATDDDGDAATMVLKIDIADEPVVDEPVFDWLSLILLILVVTLMVLFLLHMLMHRRGQEPVEKEKMAEMEEPSLPPPLVPQAEAVAPVQAIKPCSKCGQGLEPEYVICPYCGSPQKTETEKIQLNACKNCGKELEPEYVICPHCGAPA